jgi:hypothetical protein
MVPWLHFRIQNTATYFLHFFTVTYMLEFKCYKCVLAAYSTVNQVKFAAAHTANVHYTNSIFDRNLITALCLPYVHYINRNSIFD